MNKGMGDPGDYRKYVGIGLQLPSSILLGVLIGWWADGRLGTKPWLLIAGAAVGMAAGFALFITTVLKAEKGAAGNGDADEKG